MLTLVGFSGRSRRLLRHAIPHSLYVATRSSDLQKLLHIFLRGRVKLLLSKCG